MMALSQREKGGERERQSVGWKGPSAHGLQQYVKCVFLFLGLSLSYLTATSYLDELSGLSLSAVLDNEGERFDE